MENNNKLFYYIVKLVDNTLFAHGDYYDFFRMYDEKNRKWTVCKITFSQILHDFQIKEISEEEARQITNDNLPIGDYKSYRKLLTK